MSNLPIAIEDVQGDMRWLSQKTAGFELFYTCAHLLQDKDSNTCYFNPAFEGQNFNQYEHTRIVEDCKLKKPDILFVGDSIIQRMQDMDIWDEQIVPLHAVNAGIGAEQTQHVLYRLQNGLLDNCSPKIVVVWAGTNNHSHTSDDIVEGLESIAWCINNSLPNAKIVLLGLLPRGEKDNHLRKKNYEINYNLEKIVAGLPNTYYLNPDPGFIRPTGKIAAEDMLDYLHPTRRGYRRMCPIIIGLIRQLLHEVDWI